MKVHPLPTIVSPISPDLRRYLDRVRDFLDDPDGFVTKKELVSTGVFTKTGSGVIGYIDPSDTTTCVSPPAPMLLAASGAMTSVVLSWKGVNYSSCYSHTEIYRAATDDLGVATLIGTTTSGIFTDAVGSDSVKYYWVRFVNIKSDSGPYNATAGVKGETAPDLEYVLDQLSEAYGTGTDAPFFEVPGPPAPATVINGATIAPGLYMYSAFIHDAAITNAKIKNLAVDSAKIALLAVDTAQIASAAITSAKIDNLAVTHAQIASAAITNAKIHDGLQSSNFSSGVSGWRLSKAYGLEVNSSSTFRGNIDVASTTSGARMEINNTRLRVFDTTGALRITIGNLDITAPTSSVVNTTFAASVTVVVGSTITIVSTGEATNAVWIAPTGTTRFATTNSMTTSVSGTSTSIKAPAIEGTYYLYVIDAAGNVSGKSTASVATTSMADVVLAASVSAAKGTNITIVSTGTVTSEVWIAPTGTTVFSPQDSMTTSVSGTSTTITVPALTGTYYLYVVDVAGNLSNRSTATVTVT